MEKLTKKCEKKVHIDSAEVNAKISRKMLRNVRKLCSLEYFCNYIITMVLKHSDDRDTEELINNLHELGKVLPKWRETMKKGCQLEEVKTRLRVMLKSRLL